MAREQVQGPPITFLRINKDGALSTVKSEPTEGFTSFETSTGKTLYEKVFGGTEIGFITKLEIEEKTFPTGTTKALSFYVTAYDGSAVDKVELPLLSKTNALTDVAKKFIALLPGINFNKMISFSSNKKKNDRGYVDKVIFATYMDSEASKESQEGIKFSLKFGKDGNVPMGEKVESIDGESVTWDFTNQDKFLYKVLQKEIQRFKDFKEGNVYVSEFIGDGIDNYHEKGKVKTSQNKVGNRPVDVVTTQTEESATEVTEQTQAPGVETDDDLPF